MHAVRMARSWWQHPGLGLLALLLVVLGIVNVVWGVSGAERPGGQGSLVVHVLAMLGAAYLLMVWGFPLLMGRARSDSAERVSQAQASGPMLASAWCAARIGLLSFRGRLLRVSVYPGGIVLQPLLMPARAMRTSELLAVEDAPSMLGVFGPASVVVKHTAPDVRATVRLHISKESPLASAIRSLPLSGR